MKRILIALSVLALTACGTANQTSSILESIKKAASAIGTEGLNDILGSILNQVTTVDLKGNWTYQGAATAVQTDNKLTTLAATAYKNQLESAIDQYLGKIGIKAGSARFSFAEDGTFTIANANGKTITSGTWTRTENDITMAFGRTLNLLTLKGIVAATTTGCQLLFDADKFIGVLQMLSKFSGDSGTFSDIAAILDEVTGLKLGFDLVRAD